VGGTRELVGRGGPCLLFAPDDAAEFCRLARQLICDEQFRRDLGNRARQMVLREKDWKVLARRYEDVYAYARAPRQGKAGNSQAS
jgi:glycosyltransferase involved in cell wall biosynthesis